MTEKQIDDKLTFVSQEVNQLLRKVNISDAIQLTHDEKWGLRSINFFVRLDEFSVTRLEKAIPKLKELLTEYKELRKLERKVMEDRDFENAIRNSLSPSNGINS